MTTDNNSSSSDSSGGNRSADDKDTSGSGEGSKEDVASLQAKVNELTERSEQLEKQRRALARERDELKTKATNLEREHADPEQLRKSFDSEITAVKTERDDWKTKFFGVSVEAKVKNDAREFIAESALEDFWKLHSSDFELGEDDKPRVKDSVKSVRDHVKDLAERKPYLAKNPRRAGGGEASQASKGSGDSTVTVEQLAKMSKQERIVALAKNPELRERFERVRPKSQLG